MAITQLGNGRWRVQIRRKELKLDRVFDTKKEAIQAEALALGKVKPKETVKTLADVWEKYQESLTQSLDLNFGQKFPNGARGGESPAPAPDPSNVINKTKLN